MCVYMCMCVCNCVCVFVGSCLATEGFIGKLPATQRGWVIIRQSYDERVSTNNKLGSPMKRGGQLPTNQLSDSNWGALDHASRAPQLLSDNCNYVRDSVTCVYVHARTVMTFSMTTSIKVQYITNTLCIHVCWQLPSNQSFYRQIAS